MYRKSQILNTCINFDVKWIQICTNIYCCKITKIRVYHQLKEGKKEGNVLFNNFNTFYLRLYGVRHMVKDHSDSKRGNLLSPHRLLFIISRKGSFIYIIPQTG